MIDRWIEQGLEWTWYWRPVQRPFAIPAKGQVQIPSSVYTFKSSEGTLLTFNAVFDDPSCGIRYEAHPELDTEFVFTITNMLSAGFINLPLYLTAMVPPNTPAGRYVVAQNKEWPWTEWARLYLINSDSVPHRCVGYAYTMAVLKTPRQEAKVA